MAKKSKSETKPAGAVQSLAVKYRPRTLSDVKGQDQSVATLKGMLKTGKLPGAILISGPTGCGKTTLARILAAYANAESPKKVKESSSYILGEKHPDILTINAGTNGKVDEIRTLIQGSRTAPMTNYRFIVIDECHKLTGASAEALLVPLEEPPARTIWVLCTTDPEKLLPTIQNRCTRLHLKLMEPENIVERLQEIVEQEKVKLPSKKEAKKAFELIAQLSDGSMRNAISHLEGLLFAVQGGMDFDAKGAMKSYVESAAADLDKSAASVVAACLNLDLIGTVSIVRRADNPRGIVNKARWLIDYLIGDKTKTAKFTPYTGRLFKQLAEKHGIKYNLAACLMLQQVITDVELQMNSCSISEAVLLQSALGNFILENKA